EGAYSLSPQPSALSPQPSCCSARLGPSVARIGSLASVLFGLETDRFAPFACVAAFRALATGHAFVAARAIQTAAAGQRQCWRFGRIEFAICQKTRAFAHARVRRDAQHERRARVCA